VAAHYERGAAIGRRDTGDRGRRVTTYETLEYQVLRRLADGPVGNQRLLVESLGVSLGKANYVIRALVARGWVTMDIVSRKPNRHSGTDLCSRERGCRQKES